MNKRVFFSLYVFFFGGGGGGVNFQDYMTPKRREREVEKKKENGQAVIVCIKWK